MDAAEKEIYNAMDLATRERHADWKKENTAIISRSGIPFRSANNGEAILFRQPGKPKVDFYPSTGRWRIPGRKGIFGGGAENLLSWYGSQAS